ncbi:MAG TPA: adenylate/guanylate cyclase domain-containing protein [Chloroflexota bacterium]|nr:adenylate/guanylate cyclase domain-containing protein [Chloroflexota bacterium]
MSRFGSQGERSVAVAVIVGLLVSLLSGALLLMPSQFVQVLELNVSDFLFIRDGGPLLGTRAARNDIALVVWDAKSQEALGVPFPSLSQDLQLYQALIEGGARVVGDTRLLFSDTPGLESFMGSLATLDPQGLIERDASPGNAEWFVADQATLRRHIGHSPLLDPSVSDVTQFVRYYPLLSFDPVEGVDENMALKIARAMLGAPRAPDLDQIGRESGIAAIWALGSGLATEESLSPAVVEAGRHPQPYPLDAGHRVHWVVPPNPPARFLVSPAAFWISYTGPHGSYPTVSYVDALQGRAQSLAGKAVLVGEALVPGDTFPAPVSVSKRMYRVEIVAQAVQTILDGRFIETPPEAPPKAPSVIIAAIFGLAGALFVALFRPLRGSLAGVALLVMGLVAATFLYRSVTLADVVVAPGALISAQVLVGGYEYAREARARRRVADLFGRYVPRSVVARVVEQPEVQARALGGVTRDITVLFADIRGFTALSEHLAPDEVLSRLNEVLKVMVACAFRYEGTVDKYIGDAIMVLFNAPVDQTDHVERAVRTALDMQRAMAAEPNELGFGIGIHCGEAVVGTIGTPERLEYTAIGATVNLASRLCDTAKGGEVVVSDEVYRRLEGRLDARALPPIRVKNIDRELSMYVATGIHE